MQRYANNFQDRYGNGIAGALVSVTVKATGLPAVIYSDNGITPIATLTTDTVGQFAFYAADGRYNITLTKSGVATATLTDVLLEDPVDNFLAPTLFDFGAVGDGVSDNYDAINRALAASDVLFVPVGTFMTSAGSSGKPPHIITGKTLIGVEREHSIIKATGLNSGRTLFVNDVTSVSSPGTWGSGGPFRLENLGIKGNWDATTGLANVTEGAITAPVGIAKASYNAVNDTALIKGVSAAYTFIKNCYIDNAYEHGVLLFRNGYSEISSNIFARCRGSGLWLTADSSSNCVTSTVVSLNQMVACRGGYGALKTQYTYGCSFRDNRPFEDNTWGAWFGEGADTDVSGNYFEANPFGDAHYDETLWGLTAVNNYYTIPPTMPSPASFATRGFFSYDRKLGLHHVPVATLGETDNRLGPLRYSCDSRNLGVDCTPAASGTGLTFPAVEIPSTNANTLTHFASGTWTPLANGVTFSAATGTYIKVNGIVIATFSVTMPATASGAAFQIGGLPFAVGAGGGGVAIGEMGNAAGYTLRASAGNPLQALNLAASAFISNATLTGVTISGTAFFHV